MVFTLPSMSGSMVFLTELYSVTKKIKEILNSVAFRFLLYVIHTRRYMFDLSEKDRKNVICDRNTHTLGLLDFAKILIKYSKNIIFFSVTVSEFLSSKIGPLCNAIINYYSYSFAP